MNFNYIRFSGIRPFLDETAVNFDTLPGKIIALIGANGSGKTRFLELLAGGAYRTTPTRGKVNQMAADRKAVLEVGVTTDAAYVLKQLIDGQTSRAEAVVFDSTGKPLTDSGKLPEFDAWVAARLPSPGVLFATTFAPQGSAGFFGLSKADRKSVMLRALLCEHYEAMAEAARTKLRDAQNRLDLTLAKYGELAREQVDLDALRAAVEVARREAAEADVNVGTERAALIKLRAEAEAVAKVIAANRALRDQVASLSGRITDAGTRLVVIDERIKQTNETLAGRADIEAAIARVADFDGKLRTSQAAIDEKKQSVAALNEKVATRQAQKSANIDKRTAATARAVALRLRLADWETIDAAVSRLPELEANFNARQTAERIAFEALRALQQTKLDDDRVRIEKLRGGLLSIRDWTEPRGASVSSGDVLALAEIAGETIDADDKSIATAFELPNKLREALEAERAANLETIKARDEVELYRRTAARQPELAQNEADLLAAEKEIETCETNAAVYEQSVDRVLGEVGELNVERIKLEAEHKRLSTARDADNVIAGRKSELDQAQSRLEELQRQREEVEADRVRLTAERELIVVGEDPPEVETRDAELSVSEAELIARSTSAALGVAESTLQAAVAVAERLAKLEAERIADELEVADYTRLSFELGRDGLQALEIDAAGPELTELVNDLLHTCFGNRFTVAIETTRPAKSGKKEIEVFDGIVFDSEEGEKTFDQLSGGQKVIIGEAFSLALTMVACRRAGIQNPMLIRDETGAALDGDAGPAYVSMLRRASEIVGASKVIFVSHNPELHALADSRLKVEKGIVFDPDVRQTMETRLSA